MGDDFRKRSDLTSLFIDGELTKTRGIGNNRWYARRIEED